MKELLYLHIIYLKTKKRTRFFPIILKGNGIKEFFYIQMPYKCSIKTRHGGSNDDAVFQRELEELRGDAADLLHERGAFRRVLRERPGLFEQRGAFPREVIGQDQPQTGIVSVAEEFFAEVGIGGGA